MNFYKSIFGGKLELSRFGDYQAGTPIGPEYKENIMHAALTGVVSFMASDGIPGREVIFGDSVNMSLSGSDEAQLTKWFTALADEGRVTVPLEKQVWGDTFGMLTDKYGIHWLVNISNN